MVGTARRLNGGGVILALLLILPRPCPSWGHLKDIDAEPRDLQHLFVPVLTHHAINFCVAIADAERASYSETSVEAQTRMALSLWLSPVGSVVGEVAIRRVTCQDQRLDLMIDIGPDPDNPHLGAHAGFKSDTAADPVHARSYQVVKLNTHYTSAFDGTPYTLNDFEKVAQKVQGGRWPLQTMMNKVSVDTPMTVGDFSRWGRVPYGMAYACTYAALLHELGHSFGLCDTYENSPETGSSNCSDHYASTPSVDGQPFSVMKSSRMFYLTPDDKDGIVRLFNRFKDRAVIGE